MTQTIEMNEDRLEDIRRRLSKFASTRGLNASPVANMEWKDEISSRIKFPEKRNTFQCPYDRSHSDFTDNPSEHRRIQYKLQGEGDLLNSYYGHHGIVEPEYDMLEPWTILDVESYFKRAVNRIHDVMFREGVSFTAMKPAWSDYAEKRADQVSFMMKQSFQSFLKDIVKDLLICSNVFLIKVRDEEASGGVQSERNADKVPVAAYQKVPAHTMYPYLDGYGKIKCWRRFFGDGRPYRDYKPDDVVHFFRDRKPGHIFGTPAISTVRDDIFALRRLEENDELLLISYMFPFTHVAIGTPEAPCQINPDGVSEVEMYRHYIQNMPKEGVLVTDERVNVDMKGAGGKGVDAAPRMEHYENRIRIGLGVSAVDLGQGDEVNKSSADNVSQNLKDHAKSILTDFCDQFRYSVLLEWFQEAPFKVSVQNAVAGVKLTFHELDRDGQIAFESHHLNMFNNHAITHPELRQRIKQRPLEESENKETHFNRHVMSIEKHRASTQKQLLNMKTQADMLMTQEQAKADIKVSKANERVMKTQIQLENAKAKHQSVKNQAPQKPAASGSTARKSSGGGKKTTTGRSSRSNPMKTASPKAKVTSTRVQPRNQHGVNLDPHKVKSSEEEYFPILHDTLNFAFRNLEKGQSWSAVSRQVLNDLDVPASLKDRCHVYVSSATDLDTLFVYLRSSLAEE